MSAIARHLEGRAGRMWVLAQRPRVRFWRCQSGRPDLNRGPHRPERCALPGCATPREASRVSGATAPANWSKKTQKGHGLNMTAGRSRMEISMAAEPGSVRLVRTEIMRWFHELRHDDDELAASIAVAVSEAVGNVVRHAYPGEGTGRVEVEAQLDESSIVVSVSDGGSGMRARTRSRAQRHGASGDRPPRRRRHRGLRQRRHAPDDALRA